MNMLDHILSRHAQPSGSMEFQMGIVMSVCRNGPQHASTTYKMQILKHVSAS